MTDELEQQVSEMLQSRVADLPASFEVDPSTLTRVRRRRATKLGALATALVLVVLGSVAGIARAVDDEPDRIAISTEGPAVVRTVPCELQLEGGRWRPALARPEPRVPAVDDPSELTGLVSYAVVDDPRTVVLGPERWSCRTKLAPDGRSTVWLTDPRSPTSSDPAIPSVEVQNDALWRGARGSSLACSVFDDELVVTVANALGGNGNSCPAAERTVTRVDANVARFVDADGARGAAWLRLPELDGTDSGLIGVLTCRPYDRLTEADCDAIIADWIARVRSMEEPPTTTTTRTEPPDGWVPGARCEGVGFGSGGIPPSKPFAGDPLLYPGLGYFLANIDGDPRFTVLAPRGWTCRYPEHGPILVFDSTHGTAGEVAPITIDSDWQTACSVFEDQAVAKYVADHSLGTLPCRRAGRTVTPVSGHVATFVDADGTRGAAWVVLPAFPPIDSGAVSVLTCRPSTGLTAEQCDTIVADYAARADVPAAPGP